MPSPKSRYTIADLCKKMEVSEPTFYLIIRSPGANFPLPLNVAPHGGITVYYPAVECDLWIENNFVEFGSIRKRNKASLEDTLFRITSVKSEVGSVVEFHSLAGSAKIGAFLLRSKDRTEVTLRHFPCARRLSVDGWVRC
jgi:hypothetical protein